MHAQPASCLAVFRGDRRQFFAGWFASGGFVLWDSHPWPRYDHCGSPTPTEKRQMQSKEMEKKFGPPTAFVCPECHGPLWETKAGPSLQLRCHVGHAYSPDSLLANHADGLERALWSAVRTFDEQAPCCADWANGGFNRRSTDPIWKPELRDSKGTPN